MYYMKSMYTGRLRIHTNTHTHTHRLTPRRVTARPFTRSRPSLTCTLLNPTRSRTTSTVSQAPASSSPAPPAAAAAERVNNSVYMCGVSADHALASSFPSVKHPCISTLLPEEEEEVLPPSATVAAFGVREVAARHTAVDAADALDPCPRARAPVMGKEPDDDVGRPGEET